MWRDEGRRRTTAVTLAVWFAAGAVAHACPICFQVEDGPATQGVRAAVVVLASVTGVVLAGFAVFVGGIVRRSGRDRDQAR